MTTVQQGRYRHFKGNEYTVLGVALHSETHEELVVYRQEYGDHGLWVRPKQMFQETVEVDGQAVPRFQRLGSSGERIGENVKNIFDVLPITCPRNWSRFSFVLPMSASSESSHTAMPHLKGSG